MHTFLEDPENARAYAHLLAVPIGSQRTWATALGWSSGKMQRFLASLSRYRLGEIQSCKHGSVFRPLKAEEPQRVHRGASMRIDVHRPALGSTGLVAKEPSAAGLKYSTALITTMNDALVARFAEGYRAVLDDNRSSIEAADRLDLAGVPVDRAEEHLLAQCRLFNPSKHGKGELPRSLAYFERGIMKAWKGEAQLKLFPKMDMQVEPAARVQEFKPDIVDRPPAGAETIAAGVEEFRAIANSNHRPQRLK